MAFNIDVYEALKPTVGEEAARVVAQAMPEMQDLATKADFQELRHEMQLGFADLRRDFAEFKADTRSWMLRYFVPLWIGVYGTLGAIVVSIFVER